MGKRGLLEDEDSEMGDGEDAAALRAIPRGGSAQAAQRAPTLLGGEGSGGQGGVRVWCPDSRLIWKAIVLESVQTAVAITAACLVGLAALMLKYPEVWIFSSGREVFSEFSVVLELVIFMGLCGGFWVMASPVLRRKYYITTDNSGIGITRQTGSMALPWTDVQSVRWIGSRRFPHVLVKVQWIGEIRMMLYGYSEAQQQELMRLIADRADLSQPSVRRLAFYR